MEQTKIVLSGIRATGRMHFGNYLGVLERAAAMSKDPTKKCLFFIADMHTLTTHKEAELVRSHAPEIVLDMLAAGIDPNRAYIYVQSHVPSVAELAWYLACLSPYGDLERMPTFKDKSAKHPEDVNAGLFLYPVLMAADILGPRAHYVPVGQDQKPHLEFARFLARKFNRLFGDFFPVPDCMEDEMIMVPGLAAMSPEGSFPKMGKSEASHQALYLVENEDEHRKKILRAPTDPARVRKNDPGTPENCVINSFHGLVSTQEQHMACSLGCKSGSITCVDCKSIVADNIALRLSNFRATRKNFATDRAKLAEILEHGAKYAEALFSETIQHVADKMGVYREK